MREMKRARIDGLEVAYELRGAGEPVVLLHWGVSAIWAEPLLDQAALAGRYRLLSYHRCGFGSSSRIAGPIALAEHAEHCRLLMSHLGFERAHVVGHSSSALIALQLALDAPDAVDTLVLMEPARPNPPTELQERFARDHVLSAIERYRAGDSAGAMDIFLRGVFGDGYAEPFERGLPGGFEHAVADADAFFAQELPAVQQWTFTVEDASRITQPVLGVRGAGTAPTFPERLDLLLSWLPNAESVEIADATHLLHVEQPRATAEALAGFFARHASNAVEKRT